MLEVTPGERLEGPPVGQSVVVRVEDAGVDDECVDQAEGPEVVLQPVSDEYCAAGDEPHQVVLDVAEALGRAGLEVALSQPGEAGVVVNHGVLGMDQGVVHGAAVDTHLKKKQHNYFSLLGILP